MSTENSALSLEDCTELVEHLDAGLALFEKPSGRLTSQEIMMKSMLTTLRREAVERIKEIHSVQITAALKGERFQPHPTGLQYQPVPKPC